MRRGARLGVDVGKARVGVARSDADGMLAMPVETVQRGNDTEAAVRRVLELAEEHQTVELVVGLPISLSGNDTPSTQDARDFAVLLASGERDVRLVDERLSTVSAQSAMRASGRKAVNQRSVIDQAAAVVILQHALDAERASGNVPGSIVERPAADATP